MNYFHNNLLANYVYITMYNSNSYSVFFVIHLLIKKVMQMNKIVCIRKSDMILYINLSSHIHIVIYIKHDPLVKHGIPRYNS